MKRNDIIEAIYRERDRQDEKWGGAWQDGLHDDLDWIGNLLGRLHKVAHCYARDSSQLERAYVELAAVAFARLEMSGE